MTEISDCFYCTNYIIFMRKVLLASISDYWNVDTHFFLSKKTWIDTSLNLETTETTERMPWRYWQGINLPIILRFGKEDFIVYYIISTFEWWLPNNRCLTLLFLGCWYKPLLPDCLYNKILFERWISEELRTRFPFRIFWHEHLKNQAQETQISCACSLPPQTGRTHL